MPIASLCSKSCAAEVFICTFWGEQDTMARLMTSFEMVPLATRLSRLQKSFVVLCAENVPAGQRTFAVMPTIPMRAPKSKGAKAGAGDKVRAEAAVTEESEAPKGKDLKSQLSAHVEYMKRELTKIRGAVANPNMLDNVVVEAYGERQQLKEVAQIVMKNPLLLEVSPFDTAMVDAIADAIREADMGLNPNVDGNSVRVPVPKTSKETREANVKLISKIAEAVKTRIRRTRQDAIEKTKKGGEGISEDDIKRETKVIEEQIAAVTAEVAKIADKKKLEVEAT